MTTNETNGTADAMKQRRENILDLLDIMDEGNLTALRFKDGQRGDRARAQARRRRAVRFHPAPHGRARRPAAQRPRGRHRRGGRRRKRARWPARTTASVVRSPMVGTFYAGPSPDEDPFVKVGQEVLTGQTLAIVEAMKMMNEITAPAPGVITEVLAANGTQVEYDQPLFRISTSANA